VKGFFQNPYGHIYFGSKENKTGTSSTIGSDIKSELGWSKKIINKCRRWFPI
jgi:hypothetical protein